MLGRSAVFRGSGAQYSTRKNEHIPCPCPICGKRIAHQKELQRHIDTVCAVSRWFGCPYQHCEKGPWARKDRFQRHMRVEHARSEREYPDLNRCSFISESQVAYGCGMCNAGSFEQTNAFVKHVVGHYRNLRLTLENDWDRSQELRNLLRHKQAKDIWYQLAAPWHGEDTKTWPDLQWDAELTERFIPVLKFAQPEEMLRSVLQTLLECAQLPPLATSSALNYANVSYAAHYPITQVDHITMMSYAGYGPNEIYDPALLQPFGSGAPDVLNLPVAVDECSFDLGNGDAGAEDVEVPMYDGASNNDYW